MLKNAFRYLEKLKDDLEKEVAQLKSKPNDTTGNVTLIIQKYTAGDKLNKGMELVQIIVLLFLYMRMKMMDQKSREILLITMQTIIIITMLTI